MNIQVLTPYGKTGDIAVRKGTIQGDTLSPLLFNLYIEPLLRWLEVGNYGYQHKLSTVRTTAPAYADDLGALTGRVAHMLVQTQRDPQVRVGLVLAQDRYA